MRSSLFVLACLVVTSGCESLQLRNHTVQQASTLTDIQYKQVLNNFAMFAKEPETMPFYSLANKGVTTIQNSGTATAGINWDYIFFGLPGHFANHADKKNLGLSGVRQDINTWNTDSIIDPDRLQLMRCAYQKVLGHRCLDPDCDVLLSRFFKNEPRLLEPMVQPGWVQVGKLHEIPVHAAHVGHHGITFAWVMPEQVNNLALFTLAMLDISTAAASNVQPQDAKVKKEAKIKSLADQIKVLTEIYAKLPDDAKGKDKLKEQISLELGKLDNEYKLSEATAAQKTTQFREFAVRVFGVRNDSSVKDAVESYKQWLDSPPAEQPVLRPRREFYNPATQNVVPIP